MRRSGLSVATGFGVAAMLLAGGCATTGPTAAETEAFKGAVDAIFATWSDCSVNPSVDRFAALWDEKAVKMAAGREPAIGWASIREGRQKKDETTIFDKFEIKVDEYQLVGEYGWARGVYTIVTHPKAGGATFTDVGIFLTVFKKQPDGSWKVYRDTMMPLPTK